VKTDVILGRAFLGLGFADAINTSDEVAKIRSDRQQAQMQASVMDNVVPGVAKEAVKAGGTAALAQQGA
jgi:hypothetical protein